MTDAKPPAAHNGTRISISRPPSASGRLYILHSRSDRQRAIEVAAGIAPIAASELIPAWPHGVPFGGIRTVEGLAKRLAHDIRTRSPEELVWLLGLGTTGQTLVRPLISELLGLDVVIRSAIVAHGHAAQREDSDPELLHLMTVSASDASMGWHDATADHILTEIPALAVPDIVSSLQSRIASRRTNPPPPLPSSQSVLLKSGEPGEPPVFCIPGAGASIVSFVGLVNASRAELPFFGLQPRGLDVSEAPYTHVGTAAQAMEELICQSWPQGPIHLVGHSFGGCIAFETAIRLAARGRAPASLALIDSRSPYRGDWPAEFTDREIAQRWIWLSEQAAEASLGISDEDLSISDPWQNLQIIHSAMVRVGLLSSATSHVMLAGPMRTFAACLRSWYRPSGNYSGPVQLIYLDDPQLGEDENLRTAREVQEGWSEFAVDVELLRSSGNHITALKPPHVTELCDALCLADARRSSGRSPAVSARRSNEI